VPIKRATAALAADKKRCFAARAVTPVVPHAGNGHRESVAIREIVGLLTLCPAIRNSRRPGEAAVALEGIPEHRLGRDRLRPRIEGGHPLRRRSAGAAAALRSMSDLSQHAREHFWNSLLPFCYPIR
jgi:hypothetical protein